MTALLAGIAVTAVPLVLLVSVFGQVRRPGGLAAALRAHGTLPRVLTGPAAAVVITAEAVAGGSGAVAFPLGLDAAVRAACGAAAVLLALYALYAAYVSRTRRGVPCGCAGGDLPMTGWVAGRAAALSVLALAGALHGPPAGAAASELAVAVAAGLAFGTLLWTLPHAMTEERRPAG